MLLIILVALVAFIAVLCVNAAKCKPVASKTPVKEVKLQINTEEKAERLAKLIRCKTISNKEASLIDQSEFDKFKETLKELYPTVYAKAELEEIGGGLLFKIQGKSSVKPSVLMAHFDVVPVNEEKWEVSPFAGVIKDGFLWGRGTLDTKSSLFGVMEAAEELLKTDFVPENDLYLAFGCNEEVAGPCVPEMVQTLKARGIKPAFVLDEGGAVLGANISLFPHDIATIGIAEKGHMDVILTAKGQSGHSSQPPVHTAVGKLSKTICKIEDNQFPMKVNDAVKYMVKGIAPYTPFYVRLVAANMWCFAPLAKIGCKFNKTTAALLRTSMAFTQLWGSNGANVLASEAKANINIRLAPGCKSEAAVKRILDIADDKDITAEIVNSAEATEITKPEGMYWDIIRSAVSGNFANTVTAPYLMVGGTDSRHFGEICDTIFKFSPINCRGGLLGTIHSENERIRLDNLESLINFFAVVIGNI